MKSYRSSPFIRVPRRHVVSDATLGSEMGESFRDNIPLRIHMEPSVGVCTYRVWPCGEKEVASHCK